MPRSPLGLLAGLLVALLLSVCPPAALAEVEAAYERFTAGGKLGKVVLLP